MIERRPDVVEVRLFGSLARGEAHPGSDADLFVVLRDGAPPFLDRISAVAREFSGVGIGCDVIVYTESESRALQETSIVPLTAGPGHSTMRSVRPSALDSSRARRSRMPVSAISARVTALVRSSARLSRGGLRPGWLASQPRRWPCMSSAPLAGVLLLVMTVAAAADEPDAISPGRPRLTRSTATVPPGILQIETGAQYSRTSLAASPDQRRVGVVASGRTGLTERLDFQLAGEPYVSLRGAQRADDHGDVEFLLRYRVLDADRARQLPALGLLPFARAPIADAPIGSERPDFGVIGLAGFELPWGISFDVNAGVIAVGQTRPDGYLVQGLAGAFVGRDLAERVRGFVETVYTTRAERDGRDALRLNAGVVWAVARDVALDVAANTSLIGRAPDFEIRGGFSFRVGR